MASKTAVKRIELLLEQEDLAALKAIQKLKVDRICDRVYRAPWKENLTATGAIRFALRVCHEMKPHELQAIVDRMTKEKVINPSMRKVNDSWLRRERSKLPKKGFNKAVVKTDDQKIAAVFRRKDSESI